MGWGWGGGELGGGAGWVGWGGVGSGGEREAVMGIWRDVVWRSFRNWLGVEVLAGLMFSADPRVEKRTPPSVYYYSLQYVGHRCLPGDQGVHFPGFHTLSQEASLHTVLIRRATLALLATRDPVSWVSPAAQKVSFLYCSLHSAGHLCPPGDQGSMFLYFTSRHRNITKCNELMRNRNEHDHEGQKPHENHET